MAKKKAGEHSLQCVPQLEDLRTTIGTKLSFVVKVYLRENDTYRNLRSQLKVDCDAL